MEVSHSFNHAYLLSIPGKSTTISTAAGFRRIYLLQKEDRGHRPLLRLSSHKVHMSLLPLIVITDYHLDRLGVGKTPSKRRRTSAPSTLHTLASFSICLL